MEISAVLHCLACFCLKKRVTIAGMMKTGIKTSLKIFRARNFVIIFHALFLLAFTQLTTASGLFTASVVVYMHKTNIERLKNGTENRFSFKSKA